MALTLSEGATSATYTPCPAGTFPARLCALIDLGTQTGTYEGEVKSARKLLLTARCWAWPASLAWCIRKKATARIQI